MHQICLCLTTGRSGTTYLAHTLKATYHPNVDVFHEDIAEFQSKPRMNLWKLDESDFAPMRQDSFVAAHLSRIKERSNIRPYIDVGFPSMPLIPLILKTFEGRVRLLHLIRDPVTYAASMTTLGQYNPHMARTVGLGYLQEPNPLETRCAHPEYASKWVAMTAFEKALWRWAEYNLLALAIHQRFPDVPYMRLTSESLFKDADAPNRVAEFYGLPKKPLSPQPKFRNATNPNLTVYHPVGDEWRTYVNYPYVLELAERLGVPVKKDNLEARMKKYAAPSQLDLWKYRWRIRFTRAWIRQKTKRLASRISGLALPFQRHRSTNPHS
jgi:hypothetical protein